MEPLRGSISNCLTFYKSINVLGLIDFELLYRKLFSYQLHLGKEDVLNIN